MNHSSFLRFGLWAALLAFTLLVWRFQFLCDDAYISFRYAYNLAAGHGAVFNLDAVPPVEGYTEFLWVVLLAVIHRLNLDPEVLSQAMTALAGAILVIRVHQSARRQFGQSPLAVQITTWLCATCVPLAVWSTSGMGTMLFVLACFLTLDYLVGHPSGPKLACACIAGAVAVLVRADGAYWIAYVGTAGFALASLRRDRGLARASVRLSLSCLVVFALHTLWRWNYYGDWLPNTARVKLGVNSFTLMRGAHYAGSFALIFPGLFVAFLATPFMGARRLPGAAWVAWGSVPLMVAYVIFTGGDFMCYGRFLLPCLPPLFLAFGHGLALHLEPGRSGVARNGWLACGVAIGLIGLVPAWNQACTPTGWLESMAYRFNARKPDGSPLIRTEREQWVAMRDRALEWKQVGRAVALHTDRKDSIVADSIGALGYFSQRRLYDEFGLVSPEILTAIRPEIPTEAERRSPGHDRQVHATWFMGAKPTWLQARMLIPGEPTPQGIRPNYDRVIYLDSDQGFEPGSRLLLVAAKL
ncbi:MAG: hypothetical protein P1V35_12670 [Planctomycetota bacterium]|nr:hypothetical protein [Planctomycetota bacterium]